MKLRKISDQGLIDPFEGDLGEFDGVTLKFVEPVSKLICKYTGKPYTIQWQRKIEEMRDLYQKWQIEMANNFEDGERRGYIVKKKMLGETTNELKLIWNLVLVLRILQKSWL
ncbi:hypothetical protein V8V50_10550 [Ligilactobacillus salivarius]